MSADACSADIATPQPPSIRISTGRQPDGARKLFVRCLVADVMDASSLRTRVIVMPATKATAGSNPMLSASEAAIFLSGYASFANDAHFMGFRAQNNHHAPRN